MYNSNNSNKKIYAKIRKADKYIYVIRDFNYMILKNINLKIKYGDKIAITGENGNGKSTLLNVLAGLYDLQYG